MAIHEKEGSIVEIESDGNTAFVSSMATGACLDLESVHIIDVLIVVSPDEQHYVAPEHNLSPYTPVLGLSSLLESLVEKGFPLGHSLFIFRTSDCTYHVQRHHFLQAYYEQIRGDALATIIVWQDVLSDI